MACIEKIYSVSALIGKGFCNAKCEICSALELRETANKNYANPINDKNLESAIKLSARYGGWSLSLTSSGEPTCDPNSVTRALEIYNKCAQEGAYFPSVNLFSNGIVLGNIDFCNTYLPIWKKLGLTNVAISIHSTNIKEQAQFYQVADYPKLALIKNNLNKYGIGARATLLLRKGGVDSAKKYEESVKNLIENGLDNITSWPVGNPDGTRNEYTPSKYNLFRIRLWLKKNAILCHGHSWGGGVYDYNGSILRITDYVTKHDPKKDYVRQLVVFQDGTVAYSWIKEGALCFK